MVEKSGCLNTLTLLNDFVTQVVVVRRGPLVCIVGLVGYWRLCLAGLTPGSGRIFVSPHLFLFLKDGVAKTSDLADLGGGPILLMQNLVRPGCRSFAGLVTRWSR